VGRGHWPPLWFREQRDGGIISAKSRALPDERYVPFLQTDVAINPGNSGGPLFNLNGKDIARSAELPPLVTDLAPGATAKLEFWHKGKAKEISMSVGEMKTADAKGRKDSTP
jgi:S1-C subfamily serine protease